VFHDFFGHVPLLTNPIFARFMQAYGEAGPKALATRAAAHARTALLVHGRIRIDPHRLRLRVYGAGILSSKGETVYSIESPEPQRVAFDLVRVMRTDYRIDDFQRTYFVLDSFEQLFEACYNTDFAPMYRQYGALNRRSRRRPSRLALSLSLLALLRLPAARVPLRPRLCPDIDARILEWRWQASGTLIARAELARHHLRADVAGCDRMNHFVPAEDVEYPVHRGGRPLGRIATTPALANDGPADLRTRPALGMPWAEPPDPAAGGTLDHGEHREPLQVPGAGHGHEAAPGDRAHLQARQ